MDEEPEPVVDTVQNIFHVVMTKIPVVWSSTGYRILCANTIKF